MIFPPKINTRKKPTVCRENFNLLKIDLNHWCVGIRFHNFKVTPSEDSENSKNHELDNQKNLKINFALSIKRLVLQFCVFYKTASATSSSTCVDPLRLY